MRHASISGTVTDEAGEPVVGAYVRLLARLRIGGETQLAAGPGTTTDDRGAYRFAAIPPGQYLVVMPSVQWTVPASADVRALTGLSPERIAQIETAGGTVEYRRDPSLAIDTAYRLLAGTFPVPPPVPGPRSSTTRRSSWPRDAMGASESRTYRRATIC